MAHQLTPKTALLATSPRGERIIAWDKLAFEYIGARNPELARIHGELEATGASSWLEYSLRLA